MNLLITGGAGYIGSHAAIRFLDDGHAVTVVDNLHRGNRGAVEKLREHGGDRFRAEIVDIAETTRLDALLRERRIDAVLHFAALAYVGESMHEPLRYHSTNAAGSLSLLRAMDAAGVRRLVFSSTCATYGEPDAGRIPIREDCPQAPINPYGRSKRFVESAIQDVVRAGDEGDRLGCVALRYFNVAGADRRGRLGEDHRPESHLVPICLQVALGQREHLAIHGTDYPTADGTCVRDYVHVDDLVDAHCRALDATRPGAFAAWNVGTGRGHSVREVLEACRAVTGHSIPTVEGPRRPGDPPVLYAEASAIRADLGWAPEHPDMTSIVEDAWRWHRAHPDGYPR